MNRKLGWWFSGFIITCVPALSQDVPQTSNSVDSLFQKGSHEAGVSTAVLYSPILPDRGRSIINYTLTGAHFGWMLTDVNQSSWLPGNVELLGEAVGGTPFTGVGTYLVGGTGWVRYNFVEPNWRLVPFVQGGVGAELTDFDQRLIGEHFNFNLNLGSGMHCFVTRNVAIDVGCRFQHLSNARLSHTDIGVNAFGPEFGVSYFF